VKGKYRAKTTQLRTKPEEFPIVFNHCAWVAFRFVADNGKPGEEEEMEKMMESFYGSLIHSPEDQDL
jgi:hypothetical protein